MPPPHARTQDAIRRYAILTFGGICGLGALAPPLGAGLVLLFCLCASIRAVLRSPFLTLMLMAVGAAAILPILAPLLIVIAIFLFLRRLHFFLKHSTLVYLGLLTYVAAPVIQVAGFLLPLALLGPQPAPPPIIAALSAVAASLVGAGLLHLVLNKAESLGYPPAVAIEVMSIVPLLLATLSLPFLKLAIELAPDVAPPEVVPELHPGAASGTAADAALLTKAGPPLASASAIGALKSAPAGHLAGATAAPAAALATHATDYPHPLAPPDTHYAANTPLGEHEFSVIHHGDHSHVLGPSGMTESKILHHTSHDHHQGIDGHNQLIVRHHGSHSWANDGMDHHQFKLIYHGDKVTLQDLMGRSLYIAKQLPGKVLIQDAHSLTTVRELDHMGGLEMFRLLPGLGA